MIDDSASVRAVIQKIRISSAARDCWGVLGIPARSDYRKIKNAQRKWIRRLHPDRWHAIADESLRRDIQEALYQVQDAYFEALKQCAAGFQPTPPRQEPITTPPPPPPKSQVHGPAWLRHLLSVFSALKAKRAA